MVSFVSCCLGNISLLKLQVSQFPVIQSQAMIDRRSPYLLAPPPPRDQHAAPRSWTRPGKVGYCVCTRQREQAPSCGLWEKSPSLILSLELLTKTEKPRLPTEWVSLQFMSKYLGTFKN